MFNPMQYEIDRQHRQEMQRQADNFRRANEFKSHRKNRAFQMMAAMWKQMTATVGTFKVQREENIRLQTEIR